MILHSKAPCQGGFLVLPDFLSKTHIVCYTVHATLPDTQVAEGGDVMSARVFVQAVAASVVAYYICKWLDACLR